MSKILKQYIFLFSGFVLLLCIVTTCDSPTSLQDKLDQNLASVLKKHGFTGQIESTLEERLGRPVNEKLANIGKLLFFDPVTSLAVDGKNTCSGCHAPNASFGGTQSIAIGVESNGVVGKARTGPRNRRRSPTVINAAFYPRMMLNSRFEALSGSPFDNSAGFLFPPPEGHSLSYLSHLLAAQAFIPVVDRTEMAGAHYDGTHKEMWAEIARRLNEIPEYRKLFGQVFPEIKEGAPVTFDHMGSALSEFQIDLTFANAPIDQYARGQHNALTSQQKKGALLFFGKAQCVQCHAVDVPFESGNEMFTDFRGHVLGVPQIVPKETNVMFDGAGQNEDFGRARITNSPEDRYKFRTSPLRNVGLQPFFMHNGAFTKLEEAVRHHLDAYESARSYTPAALDPDLQQLGPIDPVLGRLDPLIVEPVSLTEKELTQLVEFIRTGLTDRRALPENLSHFIPEQVPSGQSIHEFEFD